MTRRHTVLVTAVFAFALAAFLIAWGLNPYLFITPERPPGVPESAEWDRFTGIASFWMDRKIVDSVECCFHIDMYSRWNGELKISGVYVPTAWARQYYDNCADYPMGFFDGRSFRLPKGTGYLRTEKPPWGTNRKSQFHDQDKGGYWYYIEKLKGDTPRYFVEVFAIGGEKLCGSVFLPDDSLREISLEPKDIQIDRFEFPHPNALYPRHLRQISLDSPTGYLFAESDEDSLPESAIRMPRLWGDQSDGMVVTEIVDSSSYRVLVEAYCFKSDSSVRKVCSGMFVPDSSARSLIGANWTPDIIRYYSSSGVSGFLLEGGGLLQPADSNSTSATFYH